MPQSDESRTAFDAGTAVRRTPDGGLAADLDPGWDVGGSILNGGYLLAVIGRAAVLDSPHPHPVAVSASYLRATGPGPVTLTVRQENAPETLVIAPEGAPLRSLTVTITEKTWFVEAVVAALVGLFLLLAGVSLLWSRRRRHDTGRDDDSEGQLVPRFRRYFFDRVNGQPGKGGGPRISIPPLRAADSPMRPKSTGPAVGSAPAGSLASR